MAKFETPGEKVHRAWVDLQLGLASRDIRSVRSAYEEIDEVVDMVRRRGHMDKDFAQTVARLDQQRAEILKLLAGGV